MNRIDKVRKKLIEKNAQAIIIMSEVNRQYVSGIHTSDGYIVITRTEAYFLIDFRYIEVVKRVTSGFDVRLLSGNLKGLLEEITQKENITSLLYEENRLTISDLDRLRGYLPSVEFEKSGRMIEELRVCKDISELESIIKAQRIAEAAFRHILAYIKPTASEKDIALELEFFMRKNGADAVGFDTISVSGANSSLPHGVPTNNKLEVNGFLTMDYGAKVDGYCSDMTRTVVLGKADERMKTIYNTVLRAQLEAIAYAKSGIKGCEADKAARDIIEQAGYGKCFGHSLGHGVGLEIHEDPQFSPSCQTVIAAGTVITVEPGIYVESEYGVRIEDMVYITESGCENLTICDKELIEL